MKIIRARIDDVHMFSKEELKLGGCCFYTKDKSCKYFFKIEGQEAILYASNNMYIDEVIDEFLFYSGFITSIKSSDGRILNERKLADCKEWIQNKEDIMIPITVIDNKIISVDGHTRLRAAIDLGYDSVYVYYDEAGDYISYFVNQAINRKIFSAFDMEIVDENQYRIKWHKFCDDFFTSVE
ncbi:ParB/RepB/Spo0J family partition protein [Tissierella sp. MB52-C2]|uniref:ParB/RepB/Spo0J family partition protein n=1 Tax=Tissierella sp. MB52-C2 TaxID=3070999 RepID=UPI00280B90B7|nr:ParB/RepB/Spo0J family partition protein [Tissierella sp. MB52-C2]WMM23859.1 ParB/RepB/Spo0J family partition protein [Tissierella sp. MB52-C2]